MPPGDKLGPYEILAPIGAGGMGEVYKARDPRLNRIVGIKRLKGQHTARFRAGSSRHRGAQSSQHLPDPRLSVPRFFRYHADGSPPLDQGARTPITIVTNWEATLKR
jgi:serine/threonine protein kinase